MGERLAKKVLLIGWDAADWKVINPLLDSGKMPALGYLVDNGIIGNLATLDPPMSPMLWTSIATGKTADLHGILGFTQPDTTGKGIRPVLSTSRNVKAIWNILTQNHFKTHVIGWWPGHPAEPVNGVYVSNFYQKARTKYGEKWPIAPGAIHPLRLEKIMASLRVHPGELTEAHLLPFVPDAAKIDQDKDKHLVSIAKILAEISSIHAATTWIMENEEWDFLAVYYDGIDHFSHGFMKFHPPALRGLPADLFELYKNVVNGGYIFHDMMLEQLLKLAGPDTTVILVSDHGFHSDHLRPLEIPKEPAGPALEHRPYGVFCMKGANIQKDERIYGASLLDITPTILTLFGLPSGRDMNGKPLIQGLDHPVIPEVIPSWEDVEGNCGMHPSDKISDPWAEQEALNQLVELGYIEAPGEDKQKAVEKTITESKFYLARVYLHSKRFLEALPILEDLYRINHKERRFGLWLAQCYIELSRPADCREIIDKIKKNEDKPLPALDLLNAKSLLADNRNHEALEYLLRAEEARVYTPGLLQQIGSVFLKMNRWRDARRAFEQAIVIDGDNAIAHHGLGVALLRMKKNSDAVEELLTAIGLLYHFPIAHYYLGEALLNLDYIERAAEAFEVCVSQSPGIKKAHLHLARLYKSKLNEPEKAEGHERFAAEMIKSVEDNVN